MNSIKYQTVMLLVMVVMPVGGCKAKFSECNHNSDIIALIETNTRQDEQINVLLQRCSVLEAKKE